MSVSAHLLRTPSEALQQGVGSKPGETMDEWLRALLIAASVALVMGVARHFGPGRAGLVAALPTVTAPTLVWLVHERGLAFAVNAAIGSVSACAMLAVFGLVYALVARWRGPGIALAGGLLGALALAGPALLVSESLVASVTLALAVCGIALAAMPRLPGAPDGRRIGSHTVSTALASGGLSMVAATLGPALGSFATGLLASLPLVSGVVAVIEHAAGGHRAAARFLSGYLAGLFGKIAFGVAFVLLAQTLGSVWALTLGCVAACVVAALVARVLRTTSDDRGSGRLPGEVVSA